LREEARYRWFLRNTVEVVNALRGLEYALYKFRRPVEHVSVDLDILVERSCVAGLCARYGSGASGSPWPSRIRLR
jgi:hypothetical protein